MLYLFFTLFGIETCNFASFFQFFFILAFAFKCESGPDKIRYQQMYVLISHMCVIDAYMDLIYIYI